MQLLGAQHMWSSSPRCPSASCAGCGCTLRRAKARSASLEHTCSSCHVARCLSLRPAHEGRSGQAGQAEPGCQSATSTSGKLGKASPGTEPPPAARRRLSILCAVRTASGGLLRASACSEAARLVTWECPWASAAANGVVLPAHKRSPALAASVRACRRGALH